VTAGHAQFAFGDKTVAVAAGDLLWWTPGQDHELCKASENFDLYVVGVSPEFSERVLGQRAAAIQGGPRLSRLSIAQVTAMVSLCQLDDCAADIQAREHRVGEFWRIAHDHRLGASKMHLITQRSLKIVQACPDLYRVQVAEQARVCPSEVSRYFHRDLGITLVAYKTRLRLMRFIQLVDAGSSSLLAAANKAGFGSYSQCHRVFQQTFGCSPRTYFSTQVRCSLETAFAADVLHTPFRAAPAKRPQRDL
jgi:AraC-like DNA-binding protein